MKNEMRNSFALLLFFSLDHVTQEYGARRSAERTAIDSLNASTLIAELTRAVTAASFTPRAMETPP
jgi:hypothetical protein